MTKPIDITIKQPKPGTEVILFFKDRENGPLRREQAVVHYKEMYTYGYCGMHKGFGMYFSIPSVIPGFKATHWAPMPPFPEEYKKSRIKKVLDLFRTSGYRVPKINT